MLFSVLDINWIWWWWRCNKLSSFFVSYSFICLLTRSLFHSIILSLCVLAKRATAQYVLYQVLLKVQIKKGKTEEQKKWRERERERERAKKNVKQNNEQIFCCYCCYCYCCCIFAHRENKQLCGFNSCWRLYVFFFVVCLLCRMCFSSFFLFILHFFFFFPYFFVVVPHEALKNYYELCAI